MRSVAGRAAGLWAIALLGACSSSNSASPPRSDAGASAARDGSAANDAGASSRDAGVQGGDAGSPQSSDASPSSDGSRPAGDASPRFDASFFGDSGFATGDASRPIVDSCDPMAQTGCQPPATKCVVENPNGGAICVARATPEAALGGSCRPQACMPGLACTQTSTQTAPTCVKICQFRTGVGCEQLGDEYECRMRIAGSNWGACVMLPPRCDPLTQAPCPPDKACSTFLRQTGTWEFRCRAAGTQGEGESCGSSGGGDCMRGLTCVSSPTGRAQCRRFCTMSQDCAPPATCSGMVRDPPFLYCSS